MTLHGLPRSAPQVFYVSAGNRSPHGCSDRAARPSIQLKFSRA